MTGVAIAGVGMTKGVAAHKQTRSRAELCAEATEQALKHAGVRPDEVDAIVIGQIDGLEPTSVGGRHIAQQLGLGPVAVFAVSSGGATGATLPEVGRDLVASGDYRTVVCVGPPTFDGVVDFQSTLNAVYAAFDPPLGMGAVHYGALMIADYQRKYGLGQEDIAQIVVKARANAAHNPLAHLADPLTVEDVLATRMLATPLRVATVCPVSSTAAALVFTTIERAKVLPNPVIRIAAMASLAESGRLAGRTDFTGLHGLSVLAGRVFDAAGIRDPLRQLDVLELFTPYAPFELMQYEALGLCGPGEGAELLRSGATLHGGVLPVNLSGGPLCTNAGVASELAPFGYLALQLMGQAVGLRTPGAIRGAAHSMGSNWFMCNAFGVLERVDGQRQEK